MSHKLGGYLSSSEQRAAISYMPLLVSDLRRKNRVVRELRHGHGQWITGNFKKKGTENSAAQPTISLLDCH